MRSPQAQAAFVDFAPGDRRIDLIVGTHYSRFLPQDKAALAAQVLNRVWEDAT